MLYLMTRPALRREQNCIAEGRWGCYLPPTSPAAAALTSKEVAAVLTKVSSRPSQQLSNTRPV